MDLLRRGAIRRLRAEHNERVTAAWVTAKLTAYAPAKGRDFQKLDKLLDHGVAGRARRRQSVDEMIAIARRWTKATESSV